MSNLFCVTNEMQNEPKVTRPRRCTLRGSHLDTCEDPENCWGCFPREATFGCLCRHCFEKATDAIKRAGPMVWHLRSIETSGQALGEKVSTSREPRLPVPESWQSADELLVALGGRPIPSTASIGQARELIGDVLAGWAELRHRVSTLDGARAAVRVTRLLQSLVTRWPDAEAEYRAMPSPLACQKCGARALYRQAPTEYLGDLVVVCENCDAEHDWWEYTKLIEPLMNAVEAERKREERRERAARRRTAA